MLQGDERQAVGGCWWLWGAGPALFVLRVPWQGVPAPCLLGGRAGLAETMQSSLGGFQPNCPAAALEE